jgi:hypothetical protein
VSLVQLSGGTWFVSFDNLAGLYAMRCSPDSPSLVEQNPPADAQPLPSFGEYFVDGKYFSFPTAGCDVVGCEPFPSQLGIAGTGYVSVGTLPRPGGGGGAGGGAAGELPAFASYQVQPPFVLTNRYFTDSACRNLVTLDPQVVTE